MFGRPNVVAIQNEVQTRYHKCNHHDRNQLLVNPLSLVT